MMLLQFGLAVLSSCTPVAVCQWEISKMIPPKPSPAKEVLNLVIFSIVLSLIWQAKQKYYWLQKSLCQYDTGLGTEAGMSLLRTRAARKSQGALQSCPVASRFQMGNFRTFSFVLRTFFTTLPIITLRSFRCMPFLRLDPLHPIIYINCSQLHPSMPLF